MDKGSADQLIEPRAPHDDLRYEELARRYNFRLTSEHARVFARLVIKECTKRPPPVRVLDIGCGRGIARRPEYQWAIRPHAGEYWGLEPDGSKTPDAGLFDRVVRATMEGADLPEGLFDVAYSYMVMEHVVAPDEFVRSVLRCLAPGGVYLFATPNRRHFFTLAASVLHAMRLDEAVLRRLKRETIDDYHYPVQYRFNSERRIRACARRSGLGPPEFAYLEARGPVGYLPGPLAPVRHLLNAKRRLLRRRSSLLTMICRLTKP